MIGVRAVASGMPAHLSTIYPVFSYSTPLKLIACGYRKPAADCHAHNKHIGLDQTGEHPVVTPKLRHYRISSVNKAG
jgi:hypothetical protein